MSLHIAAEKKDIAKTVLLPGDPLRAKFVAETYLDDYKLVNDIRNMFGYTGTYKGVPISVQGTGMGMPSMGIIASELITEYGVKNLIRIGTAGAFQESLDIGEVIIALSASTDSTFQHTYDLHGSFAPTASWDLLRKAWEASQHLGDRVNVGTVVTCDVFYEANPNWWEKWARMGVLGVEMETAALYMIAAYHRVNALSLVTVSDQFVTGERATVEERRTTFTEMMEIALETSIM